MMSSMGYTSVWVCVHSVLDLVLIPCSFGAPLSWCCFCMFVECGAFSLLACSSNMSCAYLDWVLLNACCSFGLSSAKCFVLVLSVTSSLIVNSFSLVETYVSAWCVALAFVSWAYLGVSDC